ncbi:PA14 domain-containing protein [Streptomyces sp. ZAF1911]|uniref:PA14 domain-containing protein n=1 Tax=Streptomyces sp. ZAF1911 TaxID=2944129 RepID=UPI00237AE9B1|nr:PA14 domain-containing protein [Streptomyces sp. ZAF1911]MDD9380683.1 PA14 domain-containing protein [Streptomyces sp. ZAF1911]
MTTLPRRHRGAAALAAMATACGLITAAGTTSAAAATTTATAKCPSSQFTRDFFPTTSFSQAPVRTDCDIAVDENWGTGAPAAGLPSDNFGVRWTLERDFGSGGPFTLTATGQDGIRVYLDGALHIDLWKNVAADQTQTVNVTIPPGTHKLRVYTVNWSGAAAVTFGYVPRTSAAEDKVQPLAPTGVTSVLDNATAQVKVSWAANKEMDLGVYRVYRRLAGTTAWTAVRTTKATSFAEPPPEGAGRTYQYQVRAFDLAGNASAAAPGQPVTTSNAAVPGVPRATAADTGISLTWPASPGASGYLVKRIGDPTVRKTTAPSFKDTAAPRSVVSEYQVAAVDSAGRASRYSTPVTARRPVAAPHEVTAKPAGKYVDLTWKVRPATDGAYEGFTVYRSTTLPVNTQTAEVFCGSRTSKKLPDGQIQWTCQDNGTAANTTYHYAVKGWGVDQYAGNTSVPSNTATVTTGSRDQTPPPAVTGLTARATAYGIALKWNANPAADLQRYEVYAGTPMGQDCSAGVTAYLGTADTSYLLETLPDGEELCFFVDAVDTTGNSSYQWTGDAAVVNATELDLTPSVATPEDGPVTLDATRTASGTGVELSWNKVTDAIGYLVYRWNPTTKTYEKLTTRPVTGTTYTDSGPPTGTTHFYRVTASYPDGKESAPGGNHAILPPPHQ